MGFSVRFYVLLVTLVTVPSVILAEMSTEGSTEVALNETTIEDENVTLESVFSTVDDNDTCDGNCTTITKPTTVKTTKVPTTTPSTIKPKINKLEFSSTATRTCSCNIQERICDINCCCDKDCTYDMRQVFGRCNDDIDRVYDTSFCEYTKFIYKNNTPYEWTVNQNGLFCVVKANLPRQYYMHKEVKLSDLNDASIAKQNKFTWSSKTLQSVPNVDISKGFSYGKPAWLVKEQLIIPWDIPDAFHTDSCSTTKRVHFLWDIATRCTQYNINNNNKQLDIHSYIQNISVVTMSPATKYFNQKRLTLLQGCPKDVCMQYDVLLCDEFLQNCSTPNKNMSLKHECHRKNSTYSCTNLLRKLQYNIYHNGTQGIKRIDVLVSLINISYSFFKPILHQQFGVKFLWVNHSFNYTLQRSGNPGYIFEKPILMASLVREKVVISKKPLNFSTNVTVRRSLYNIAENFLTFPLNQEGKCILTNNTNSKVQFGVNTLINCKIQQIFFAKSKKSKEICQEIQLFIATFWSLKFDNSTKLFGRYGNANVSNLNDWCNVSYTLDPQIMLKRVGSVFSPYKSKINCINLYTKLKIDVFHARSIVEDLHNQEQIVWITYTFDHFKNYTFQISDTNILLSVPIRSEVAFYDVTTEKFRKYAEPPSLDIKLPYDFFYPFVKIESGTKSYKPSYIVLTCVMFIICNKLM